ncbi:MAG: DUF1109 domain-containing protein [Rhodobacteraceae bacterium]|nr:MAG: DUF1109 domain-containing protein [Paracoccaceae bacterium]
MKTEALIDALARDAGPVRVLPPALWRVWGWLLIALSFAAAMVWAIGPRDDLADRLAEARFLFEQGAALATAIVGALAALKLTMPDAARVWRWLPAIPGAAWLGTLGLGCLRDWAQMGPAGLRITPDPECFVYIALIGSLPLLALILMLRKGAPLRPSWTLALAALAAAAIGSFALRLFHTQDAALMVLVWQVGAVALIAAIAALCGRSVLRWPGVAT